MIKNVFTCDVCGAERKEANHWFVACTDRVGGHMSMDIYPWPTGCRSQESIAHHLCGQSCLHKFVDQTITSWSKPEQQETVEATL